MKNTNFEEQVQIFREHLEKLVQRARGLPSQDPLLQEALEELSASFEELQVTGEELRVQNDGLLATRNAVEAERQRYQELFDFTPDGYLMTDPFGTIKEANRAVSALFSTPIDFLLGKSIIVFVAEEEYRPFRNQLLRMSRLERLEDWEVKLRTREDHTFLASITVTAIRDQSNKLTGLRWMIRDITKHKEMEKQISYLASFPLVNPNPIVEVDLSGTVHFINPSAKERFPDLKRRGAQHPWLKGLKEIAEAFKRGRKSTISREVKIDHSWWGQVWCQVPNMDRMRIYSLDITGRKQMEESLRHSEMKFRIVADNTYSMEFWIHPEGHYIFVSPSCKRITGHDPDEFMEDPNLRRNLIHPDDLATFDRHLREVEHDIEEKQRTSREVEFRIIRPEGSIRWIGHICTPIYDEEGLFLGIRGTDRDISERRKAEEALRRSKERFELLSKTADRLLAADKPQDFIHEICEKVLTFLDCHAFFNYLVDEEKGRLHLNAYEGVPEETAKQIEWLDYGVAVSGCAARDACRIIVEDILNTPDPRTELVKSFGIKAYACYPLFSGGRVIGTLSFGTRSRITFTEEELLVMKTVSDQVAIAMERMRLIESLHKSRNELEMRVKQRTAELAKVNELLERMFSSIDVMIAYMDKDFNFIRVNRAYAEADEREPEFYLGKNHFALFPNEENEQIFKKVVETDEPYSVFAKPFEYAEHPERGVTYWDWSLQPVKEPDGSVGGVILSLVNVTDRILAQEAVETERRRFSDVLEMLPVYLVLLSPDYHVPFANRFFRERFGESLGRRCFEYLFRRSEPCEVCETYKVIKTKAPHQWEWTGPDGHIYDVYDFPFTDTDGSTLILEMGIDITERKEAQRHIEATNTLLSLFVQRHSRKDYLHSALELIQNWSGCRCAGIRVVDNQGHIPYESYQGFSREFWEAENFLSIRNDQCACIRIITGRMDPQDLPVVTPGGSFCCGNTL